MLEKEIEVYNKEKAKLIQANPNGGYAVIKDDIVLGVWNDRQDAIKEGIKAWGNVAFLVKSLNDSPISNINFTRKIKFASNANT